ncbi:MAG: hypothetical protein N2662_08205 [Bacteroidales bacterium]|nr:hypothetical protein [Bacteroidales bacterium]
MEKDVGVSFISLANIRYILYPLLFVALTIQVIIGQKIKKNLFNTFFLALIFVTILQLIYSEINFSVLFRLLLLLPLAFVTKIEYRYPFLEKILLTVAILLSIVYSYSLGFIGNDNRFVANSDDPNVSALTFLLGFYFSHRRDYKVLKLCFLLLGLFTLSRNFIGSIIIFYLISYSKKNNLVKKILLKIPIWTAILVLNFTLFSVGSIVTLKSKDSFIYSVNNSSRILHWKDTSNKRRMLYNQLAIIYLFSNSNSLIYGYGENYTFRKDIIMPKSVHNTFLDIMMSYGVVFAVLLIIVISKVLQQVINETNFEYFYSYLFFTLFLPGCFSGFILYAFYAILSLQKPEKT